MSKKHTISSLAGAKLKKNRKIKGYTVKEMARLINKSEQQITRYERGLNKIDLDTLMRYMDILKINTSSFFDELMIDTIEIMESEEIKS